MTLARFIQAELDHIVTEWEGFARTILPVSKNLSPEDLRDHARVLLVAVVADMASAQSKQEQKDKSRGDDPRHGEEVIRTACAHAQHRFSQGFSLDQMVSEYRALRASVIRRWTAQLDNVDGSALDDLTRFGETMDQGLTEAVVWYSARLDDSRNLLLGVLGHDLRNPLGAVHMSATYLLRTEGLSGLQTKAVSRILNSADNMRKQVSNLLDFTQTLLGRTLPIAPASSDLGEVCREAVDELGAFHPEATLRIESSGELSGQWDAGRIGQMVSNLVANAIQHGDADKPVTVIVNGEPTQVTVTVHNEGPPVSAETRGTLFEPLMHAGRLPVDALAGSSGMGLGLFIARAIAVAHGGTIEMTSTLPDGTTFSVSLPRRLA